MYIIFYIIFFLHKFRQEYLTIIIYTKSLYSPVHFNNVILELEL